MSEKYKVAGYLRLSQEDGDKDVSDSIVSQKNIIEKKVQELGEEFFLVDYYIDDGYTGLNTNRPSFQRMIKDIENGTINCIITKDLSRLSRNSFEANYYIELYFLERNIRYISVLDNVDTGTKNANNDMIQFKTLINDWYSKDISRKVKSSVWARKEKGMYMGSIAPYGYKKSKEDKHKLVISKQESRIVKRIYEEYSKGKSITEIIKGLQADNIPSPNNNSNNGEIRYKWREETIRRMLSNKVYLGHTEYGKKINLSYKSKKRKYIPPEEWKIAYDTHEAIITEELFNKVQSKRNMNKTIKRKKHEWILNGLVKCKECGGKMTLKVEYKRDNPEQLKSKKICCLNGLKRYRGKDCIKGSKGLDEKILNTIICKNLKETIGSLDKKKIKKLIMQQKSDVEINKVNDNKELLNKELLKIENEIKTLYLDYKEELLDKEDYKKYYKEKLNEKNRIKNELELLEKEENNKKFITEEKLSELVKDILNMKEYRAGIYLRLSREHEEENNSIEAQREITTGYAIKNGYKIVKEYVDNGYSGILDSRPKLNEMILDISRGFINMVIVKDISRLTRDKNKTGWYTEVFFPDNDVRFISVTEFIDSGERYEIDDSIMLRGIANQYYITDISRKVRANKNAMKQAGKFVEHYAPYGYKKADDDKHKIIIDENVADNIRKIYDMYISGKTSSQIAEYFNSKKIKTPSKYMKLKNSVRKWNAEQINDMLRNPFYCRRYSNE